MQADPGPILGTELSCCYYHEESSRHLLSLHMYANVFGSKDTLIRAQKSRKGHLPPVCVRVLGVEIEGQGDEFCYGGSQVLVLLPSLCLDLSMSFSISGPQSPHLLDDRVGLDHLQVPPALTHQDSVFRRGLWVCALVALAFGLDTELEGALGHPRPLVRGMGGSDYLLSVPLPLVFSVTLLSPDWPPGDRSARPRPLLSLGRSGVGIGQTQTHKGHTQLTCGGGRDQSHAAQHQQTCHLQPGSRPPLSRTGRVAVKTTRCCRQLRGAGPAVLAGGVQTRTLV